MPNYQFRCRSCGRHFELTTSNSDDDKGPECPYCQSQDVELKLSSLFVTRERPVQVVATTKESSTASNCGSPGPFS